MSQQQRPGGGARPPATVSGATAGGRGKGAGGGRPSFRPARTNTKFKGETEGLEKCKFDECNGSEA